ncbi:Methionine-binding lipoprotein MetQ precursor [Corynebacterium ciconiae DSM 44920]|uniref:MetQ/NlpA family ABC transporter substrate-binding protein n=1 Tax=Corynebacterium ciconiae TaxID=227319 RepID=UPI000379B9DB|nr:MetQ/NlpA family ABC transporter substrate-binding protein [Corynebacterium ciconiae]WKD61570.1 Methionine-binding lipoprotein MetQ precursor [Corynebacterium ciconiae DSM 44920]
MFKRLAAAVVCVLALSACSSEHKENTLTLVASPEPHARILNYIADEGLAEGVELDVKVIQGGIDPNHVTANGDADANFFQHDPYLQEWSEENDDHSLRSVAAVHLEPLTVFSTSVDSLEQLPAGATVTIPNDPVNRARALSLLAENNLIEIDERSAETAVEDITANPRDLTITLVDARLLPQTLEDKDVAVSVINGNFALEAGLNYEEDSLAGEDPDNNPYVNILVAWQDVADSPQVKALATALQSPEVAEFIRNNYHGAVLPAQH